MINFDFLSSQIFYQIFVCFGVWVRILNDVQLGPDMGQN